MYLYNKYKYIHSYILLFLKQSDKLQFRHSDNINYFFDALKSIQFPDVHKILILF